VTLEQTLARLEEIVARLDEERMDLGEAEARVKRLTEEADGTFTLEELDG
jgi:exonuclease VII small subunit